LNAPVGYLTPAWPAPPNVHAAFTLRCGGVSLPPFDTLNLGAHVGDLPECVAENRRRVHAALELPASPTWLTQVHGTRVVDAERVTETADTRADALILRRAGEVAAIQVADCLPVLLSAPDGAAAAAAHAGWRGLAAGVLEATVAAFGESATGLIAWLGPAIGAAHFEVGAEVRAAFVRHDTSAAAAFTPNARGRWQCNLTQLARQRLRALGVQQVYGGEWCTFADPARFYSHRREPRCGRMAALLWLS
jgi:YfiH family protein